MGANTEKKNIGDILGFIRMLDGSEDIFCYFVKGQKAIFPSGLAKKYGFPREVENMPEWFVQKGYCAPESVEEWRSLFAAIDGGAPSGWAEIYACFGGGLVRHRLRFSGIKGGGGKQEAALIFVEDVTAQHYRTQEQALDINGLIQATHRLFSELLSINLSQNTYRMIQYDAATTLGTPRSGIMDDMISLRLPGVVEEDRDAFAAAFSRERLLAAFESGRDSVSLAYRRPGRDGKIYWFETIALRQQNPFNGDILAIGMSRNVDEQKAEEIRLREQVRLGAEELRLSVEQFGKAICYYDIGSSVLTVPQKHANRIGLAVEYPNFPECLEYDAPEGFLQESKPVIAGFYNSLRRGENGSCEYRMLDENGVEIWERLEGRVVFDAKGRPARAVVAVHNITNEHALGQEQLRLAQSERMLRLVGLHSGRVATYFDMRTGKTRFVESAVDMPEPEIKAFLKKRFLLPESAQNLESMSASARDGVPFGEGKLQFQNDIGESRWVDVKFSTLYDEDKNPYAALFSFADVTAQYERELAYLRQVERMEEDGKLQMLTVESDLTADRVEKLAGRLMKPTKHVAGISQTAFIQSLLRENFPGETREQAAWYFSREALLERYARGEHQLLSEWHLHFEDGKLHWGSVEVAMLEDPYSGHVKAFFRVLDITDEKEREQSLLDRVQLDGMTGLLNRAACEERIMQEIAQLKGKGGVLALVDLDDLKSINDTFGHSEGDRAITGLADTLKNHFRSGDIIGRLGGDEFMVFLPGAAGSSGAISRGLKVLMEELARIKVGPGGARSLHCSIGCTEQLPEGDSFDAMYRRADLALYHAKRGGKASFEFYSKAMEFSL